MKRVALTTSSNPAATITYDYDNGARLAKKSWTIAGFSGTRTETTAYYPSGQVQYKSWPDGGCDRLQLEPLDL